MLLCGVFRLPGRILGQAPSLMGCARMNNEMAEKSQMEIPEDLDPLEGVDVTEVARNSPVLARLVEEVRNKQVEELNSYNRMHNRHNR